jgi:hypothetical protein
VVEAEAVLDLDDEAGRLAQVERDVAAERGAAGGDVARRVDGVGHRHPQPVDRDRAALVHPDHPLGAVAEVLAQPQAQLVDRRPARAGPPGDRQGVPQVVEMAVRHEEDVAPVDRIGRLRALRVAEPGVDQDRLAARRPDLDAGVAVPGETRVATETHRAPPGSR